MYLNNRGTCKDTTKYRTLGLSGHCDIIIIKAALSVKLLVSNQAIGNMFSQLLEANFSVG